MQAFERLNLVRQSMDDSGGYRLDLEAQLGARLVKSFHKLDWPLEQKANWLHEHQYKYDVFPYIPEQFELPAELLSAFTHQANQSSPASDQLQAVSAANKPNNVSMALIEKLKNEVNK